MRMREGFTLVEMLVVIGIIGILIVALVPVVKGAQERAKEGVVKTNCANIEVALANHAQSHDGNYPGLAVDVMAPFADHALGDPDLFATSGITPDEPDSGWPINGIIGGFGHRNGTSTNVVQQLKSVKDTPLVGNQDTQRYFDTLIASGSLNEYPANPLIGRNAVGEEIRMRNIFRFEMGVGSGFDPLTLFTDAGTYNCWLYTDKTGTGSFTQDVFDNSRGLLDQAIGTLDPSLPQAAFATANQFGIDEGDFFAAGDFAYVPIMGASAAPFGDSGPTLENENYRWGVSVTGYLLFGYGSKDHRGFEFEEERREFASEGLPNMGAQGVDTLYETRVLQLFDGAIYFSKKT